MGRTSDARQRLIEATLELMWIGSYASTSVEDICSRAEVKKGSFYYFFESKSDLALVSVQSGWDQHRNILDHVFSPSKAPLERIFDCLVHLRTEQEQMHALHGRVLGCPVHTIGSELGGSDSPLQPMIKTCLQEYLRYFETALRDAHALGQIEAPEASAKAHIVFFYIEGLLTHARIWNDLSFLDQMEAGVRELLGLSRPVAA